MDSYDSKKKRRRLSLVAREHALDVGCTSPVTKVRPADVLHDTAPPGIYTLTLHDALPICIAPTWFGGLLLGHGSVGPPAPGRRGSGRRPLLDTPLTKSRSSAG